MMVFLGKMAQMAALQKVSKLTDTERLGALGKRIQSERKRAGLSQRELAEAIRVQLRTINKFESGQINIPTLTLYRIREALGCKWDHLLGQ